MVIKIKEVRPSVLSLMLDGALYLGRQGFGSVTPEIRIIEGRIIKVLLYSLTSLIF